MLCDLTQRKTRCWQVNNRHPRCASRGQVTGTWWEMYEPQEIVSHRESWVRLHWLPSQLFTLTSRSQKRWTKRTGFAKKINQTKQTKQNKATKKQNIRSYNNDNDKNTKLRQVIIIGKGWGPTKVFRRHFPETFWRKQAIAGTEVTVSL